MKPEASLENQGSGTVENSASAKQQNEAKLPQKPTRRRTKTGCITCRKRRIKCGEERPVCSNCVKSRRQCEGYRPPIVFRRSMMENRNYKHTHGLLPIQSSSFHHGYGQYSTLSTLAQHTHGLSNTLAGSMDQIHPAQSGNLITSDSITNHQYVNGSSSGSSAYSSIFHYSSHDPLNSTVPLRRFGSEYQSFPRSGDKKMEGQTTVIKQDIQNTTSSFVQTIPESLISPAKHALALGNHFTTSYGSDILSYRSTEEQSESSRASYTNLGIYCSRMDYSATSNLQSVPAILYRPLALEDGIGPQQILEDSAVEFGERSLTEVEVSHKHFRTGFQPRCISPSRNIKPFRRSQSSPTTENEDNSRSRMLSAGAIDLYRVELTASPLSNTNTARVFNYYRTVTAPLICPWSRNPEMTAETLHKLSIPVLTRSFFIYTVPLLALQDRGLLHALLALTSLHMAKNHGISTTPALKHYSWSLKRVHHSVRNQSTRLNVATLAATLYLSMYEIMTADHGKWNTHLDGAGQLMKEVNFAELTGSMYALEHDRELSGAISSTSIDRASLNKKVDLLPTDAYLAQITEVDHNFVRCISGPNIEPLKHTMRPTQQPTFSIQDVQFYPVLQDIFWWFVKMDVIRAIVGGSPLMLGFQRILEIPPRATLHGEVYGASDHLHILIARLVDFTSRDRARKVKAAESTHSLSPHVQFYGLAPYTEQDHMPSVFRPSASETTLPATSIPEPLETDLKSANIRAVKEWNDIRDSFSLLESRFLLHYSPLPAKEFSVMTPFGPAVQFQTFQIGCLWATYYMACIFLHRVHPTMPPQHTLAIGIAAEQTKTFANMIGRIVAGMHLDQFESTHKPVTSAAFAECSMPIFMAGVQYQDNEQRQFTVARLREIERLTGRASVGLQAKGCEVVWQRAHAAGRGPPFERKAPTTTI